jgi:aminoglycoside phosphotransferase (APT) family kinase protein
MDLHCGNIMVLDGKVSGIIDWEFAGWYTRRLEVVGGVKDLVSRSELPLYKEAWTISDKFEQHIIRSLPRLLRGFKKVDRERINAARLIEAGDDPFKEWRERQTRVRMAKS